MIRPEDRDEVHGWLQQKLAMETTIQLLWLPWPWWGRSKHLKETTATVDKWFDQILDTYTVEEKESGNVLEHPQRRKNA